MPRLETFTLTLKTGERGLDATPQYLINGFALDFDSVEGGTGPGETLKATGDPQSFPHSLVLRGPVGGPWDIESAEITYDVFQAEPYTIRLGSVTLDDESDLNIWYERPEKVVDV